MKILILAIVIISIPVFIILKFYSDHPCIKSHEGLVHHNAWTQFVITSVKPLIMVPIFHPEYDAIETICDERK